MRKSTAIAAIMIVAGLTQVASAHENEQRCRNNQTAERLSNEQFRSKVDALGYSIDRMKVERGCIEARLTERSNGAKVKALFDATTGELVRARPAS